MSSTTPANKPKAKPKDNAAQPSNLERLKTVIRCLPPNLPEDVFWQSVEPWVSGETVTWKVYYPGKLRKWLNKENIPSRAYIAFKNEEQLTLFSREYDGHLFRDKTGAESQAVVEFAPWQKIPSEKKKVDPRNATVEQDEDYISFLNSLQTGTANPEVSLESLVAAIQPRPQPKTTPLLDALKAEKTARLEKEALTRIQVIPPPKKDEPKKKTPPAKQPLLQPAESSKKSLKKGSKPPSVPKNPNSNVDPTAGSSSSAHEAQPISAKNPQPVHQPPNPPKLVKSKSPAVPPPSARQAPLPEDNPTPAERRPRAVIGLGSRQFEAALSGVVGVGGERRIKKEKGTSRNDGDGDGISGSIDKGKKRRDDKDKPSHATTTAPITTILHRPAPPTSADASTASLPSPVVAKAAAADDALTTQPLAETVSSSGSGTGGPKGGYGGKRGRGRGRRSGYHVGAGGVANTGGGGGGSGGSGVAG